VPLALTPSHERYRCAATDHSKAHDPPLPSSLPTAKKFLTFIGTSFPPLEKQLVAIVKQKMKPGAKAVAESLLGIVKRRDPAATMLIVCDEAAEVPAADKRRGK
jgi:hypothetical protein